MKHLQDLARDQKNMAVIVQLTNAFEGLASMRISQIKGQVLQAQQFFNELWQIYQQLRVDSLFRYGRGQAKAAIDKELFIIITAEGGFSGDIDQRLVEIMVKDYRPDKQDIIVIGHHGAILLAQAGITYKKYFKLPVKDKNINVQPLITEIRQYRSTFVYYQTYVSLMRQEVQRIALGDAVQAKGKGAGKDEDTITDRTYIFEPTSFAVVAHLERSMLQIALAQLIFESKLAQYASRFRAMSGAHGRATDSSRDLHLAFNRARREQRDERLKEMVNGLKKARTA